MTHPLNQLRYMARQYASGQLARGGGGPHYLEEVVRLLEEQVAMLERISHLNSFRELNAILPDVRQLLEKSRTT